MNSLTGLITTYLVVGIYDSSVSQIFNGYNAPKDSYPYQASLRESINKTHFCGGAIINKNYIITAVHCINDVNDLSDISVAVGSIYLDKFAKYYDVARLFPHKDYDKSLNINDIGLVHVLETIRFNNNIQQILLPSANNNYDNHNLIVTGWGQLSDGDSGSPLVAQNSKGKRYLIGIVVFNYLPCGTWPDVHTRVFAYIE